MYQRSTSLATYNKGGQHITHLRAIGYSHTPNTILHYKSSHLNNKDCYVVSVLHSDII